MQDSLKTALKDGTLHRAGGLRAAARPDHPRSCASWLGGWRSRTPTSAVRCARGRPCSTAQSSRHSGTASSTRPPTVCSSTTRSWWRAASRRCATPRRSRRPRLQWRKADIAIGKAGVEATEREGAATVVLDEADIELARPADRPSGPHPAHSAHHPSRPDRQRAPR